MHRQYTQRQLDILKANGITDTRQLGLMDQDAIFSIEIMLQATEKKYSTTLKYINYYPSDQVFRKMVIARGTIDGEEKEIHICAYAEDGKEIIEDQIMPHFTNPDAY